MNAVLGCRRGCLAASKADTVVQAIWEAWLYVTPMPWSQEAEENAWLQPMPISKELLSGCNQRIFYVNDSYLRQHHHSLWPPLMQKQMSLFILGPLATIQPNTVNNYSSNYSAPKR